MLVLNFRLYDETESLVAVANRESSEEMAKDPDVAAEDEEATKDEDVGGVGKQPPVECDNGAAPEKDAVVDERISSNDTADDFEWATLVECETEKSLSNEATPTVEDRSREAFGLVFWSMP